MLPYFPLVQFLGHAVTLFVLPLMFPYLPFSHKLGHPVFKVYLAFFAPNLPPGQYLQAISIFPVFVCTLYLPATHAVHEDDPLPE